MYKIEPIQKDVATPAETKMYPMKSMYETEA